MKTGRPLKKGLDYMALESSFFQDDKFQLILADVGMEGVGIVLTLLAKIYAEGYYYRWGETEVDLMAAQFRTPSLTLAKVIYSAVKRGLFDGKLLETRLILTSKGIQRRYFAVVKDRTKVEIEQELLLIDLPDQENFVFIPTTLPLIPEKTRLSGEKTGIVSNVSNVTCDVAAPQPDAAFETLRLETDQIRTELAALKNGHKPKRTPPPDPAPIPADHFFGPRKVFHCDPKFRTALIKKYGDAWFNFWVAEFEAFCSDGTKGKKWLREHTLYTKAITNWHKRKTENGLEFSAAGPDGPGYYKPWVLEQFGKDMRNDE